VAVHDDAVLMLEDDAPTDAGRERELDAVEVANRHEQRAPEHAERRPAKLRADGHSPHAEAVDEQRLEARPRPVAVMRLQILLNEAQEASDLRLG
jgi:hypothetical protein